MRSPKPDIRSPEIQNPEIPDSETGDRQQATGDRRYPEAEVPADGLVIGSDIAARFLDLAARTFYVAKSFPRDATGRHVALQVIRSVTGGGANYEEARAAESRPDFIHKVGVAAKEVRETIYWLRFVHATKLTREPIGHLIREAIELAAILAASIRTARRNHADDNDSRA